MIITGIVRESIFINILAVSRRYLLCQCTSRFAGLLDSGFRRNGDASVGVLNPTENKLETNYLIKYSLRKD
jgi:hypothetical protein